MTPWLLRSLLATVLVGFTHVQATVASAETFPSKSIRLVVPYPAGGGTDIMARLLGEQLRESLGQPVVVENKPGAGGALGAAEVARSTPDGHTLLLTAGGFVIGPSVLKSSGYDPVKEFVGVAQIAIVPLILVTRPDSPLTTFADLRDQARRDGDRFTFASFGVSAPAIRERIVSGGSVPIEPALSASQWTEQYRREVGQWADIVHSSGVRAD